jgi:hypothetical protein
MFTVFMVCGQGDTLYATSEPSPCVYEAKFKTPAACQDTELAALVEQLNKLERLREEISASLFPLPAEVDSNVS